MNFFTRDALCHDGRIFLSNRGLSIPESLQLGVASANGEIAFPFVFNGEVVRIKYRNMEDKKKMRMNAIDENSKANIKMPFWNQKNWPRNDYLIITEGELDAIAISQLGAKEVVSLPNGSGSVATSFKNNYDYLQKFSLIYLAFDMDAAGNKAVEEAKKLIPLEKLRRINFPVKDANDWIKENPTVTLSDLQDLMRNATKFTFDEIVHFRDLPKSFYKAREEGVSTGFKDLDRYLGGIRTKELTVISADSGAGKTTFCTNLLCNLIKQNPSGFWINSWEMDYETMVRKVAGNVLGKKFKTEEFTSKHQKDFDEWMTKNNVFINPKRSRADIATLRKQIELVTKVYGIKYVLLDHLDYISAESKERDTHDKIRETMCALHEMSMEFDVHIFLIAHMKQTDDGTGKIHMGQLKGSSAIKQYADNIILLQNMSQIDLSTPDNRMRVSLAKNRFLGSRGEFFLRYLVSKDSYEDNYKNLTEEVAYATS